MIVVLIIFVIILIEGMNLLIHGKWISNGDLKYIKNAFEENSRLSIFSEDIIVPDDFRNTAIFKVQSLFCRYCVDNLGMVPRWSKAHKFISELHKSLLKSDNKKERIFYERDKNR